MYNFVSKLLVPLADPLVVPILSAVAALLFWKRRRLAAGLLVAAVALLLVFSSRFESHVLVSSLENQYPDSGLNVPPAQAIVVLGGSIRMPTTRHPMTGLIDGSDRLMAGFRLYRAGKAPLLFCTGGRNPLGGKGRTPEAVWMERLLEEWGVPSTAIQIEGGSINTHENAILSYQALAPRGIRRILLVTSAMHMPRSVGAFRKAGFEVIAAPADFHAEWGESYLIEKWLPSAGNLHNSELALYEWLGIATYRVRGWM